MKHYEKIILEIDKLCEKREIFFEKKKIIVFKPNNVVDFPFNQTKPYKSDYFDYDE